MSDPQPCLHTPALLDHHRAELHRSGISDETIARHEIYSEIVPDRVRAMLGWKLGKGKSDCVVPAIIFRHLDMQTGKLNGRYTVKPDTPRIDKIKKKPIKYETQKDQPNTLFVPIDTYVVLQDPTIPLIVTEGAKKALAGTQAGYAVISLSGVFGWKQKGKEWGLPEFNLIALDKRIIYICFDSDAADNPNVGKAERRLAKLLTSMGAIVKIIRLDVHQIDLINNGISGAVVEIYAKGCTASGKTTAAAILACLWFVLHQKCKIVLTSQRYEHARDVMFGEISAWWRRSAIPMPGELGRAGIFADSQRYLTIANPQTGEGFIGQHGPATLFIFDEATAISVEFYDMVMTQAKLFIALANPRTLAGNFRRGFPVANPNRTCTITTALGPRRCISIDGAECANVIEGREVIPGQISRKKFEALRDHPNPRFAEIFAHGRFPAEDSELQIIVPSWLPRHHEAWTEGLPVMAFGLDVAASTDGDTTVLASGSKRGCARLHTCQYANTMRTVGWVIATARDQYHIDLKAGNVCVAVDGDGLGLGVADRLRELNVRVLTIRGSETPDDPRTYGNRRAELYGQLGKRLDPTGPHGVDPWRLPDDQLLAAELVAPERIYLSDGVRFRITPKTRAGSNFDGETLKERLGRSPDRADAVVYLYAAAIKARDYEPPKFMVSAAAPGPSSIGGGRHGILLNRPHLDRDHRGWTSHGSYGNNFSGL